MTNPNPGLFVDTAGWVAYYVGSAQFHAQAVSVIDASIAAQTALVTTTVVLSELSALLTSRHYRLPQTQMLDVVDRIRALPSLVIFQLSPVLDRAAWARMRANAVQKWSHCDAVSMELMTRLGLTGIVTADQHFTAAGFTRLLTVP